MEAKLLGAESGRSGGGLVELDDIHVAFGRRLYSQFDLIILFANCVNACFSIPAAVSLIPNDDATSAYSYCTYGEPLGVFVQCPYTSSPIFIGFLAVCSLYFISFIGYKIYRTFDYFTNDLRFYIASDMLVNDFVHRAFVYFGLFFTVAAGLAGTAFVIQNGTTDSIGAILTFVCVNFYTFFQIMKGKYATFSSSEMLKLFPNPVYFRLPKTTSPLKLIFTNHSDIFNYLFQVTVYCNSINNDVILCQIADPSVLKAALLVLSETQR